MSERGPGFDPSDRSTHESAPIEPGSKQFDPTDPGDVRRYLDSRPVSTNVGSSGDLGARSSILKEEAALALGFAGPGNRLSDKYEGNIDNPFDGYNFEDLTNVYMDSQEAKHAGDMSSEEAEAIQLTASKQVEAMADILNSDPDKTSEKPGDDLMASFRYVIEAERNGSSDTPTPDEIIDRLNFEDASDKDLAKIAAQAKAAKKAGSLSRTADKLVDRTLSGAEEELSKRGLLDDGELESPNNTKKSGTDVELWKGEESTPGIPAGAAHEKILKDEYGNKYVIKEGEIVYLPEEVEDIVDPDLPKLKAKDTPTGVEDPKPGVEDPKPGVEDPKPGVEDPKPVKKSNGLLTESKLNEIKEDVRKNFDISKINIPKFDNDDDNNDDDENGNPRYWNPNNLDAQQAAANAFNVMSDGRNPVNGGREHLNPDGTWNANNLDAQQAAENAIGLMANPYGEIPEVDQAAFDAAQEKYTKLAAELRVSETNGGGKLWGKIKGLFSKLNGSTPEAPEDKLKSLEEAKKEMNKILNENALVFCFNLTREMKNEGKTDQEIEETMKQFSTAGDLENQKAITDKMNTLAQENRKEKGLLGRWFNDLDKEGNSKGSNKFVRFMKKAATVGILAGGVGFVAGAAVALAPVSGLLALGVNAGVGLTVAYSGGKFGKAVARSGYEQQNRVSDATFQQSIDSEGMRDLGFSIDAKVKEEREANTKLVKKGQKIGRIAAGIGFGAGRMAGNLWESSNRIITQTGEAKDPFANWSQERKDAFARMVSNTDNFDRYRSMVEDIAVKNIKGGMSPEQALNAARKAAEGNIKMGMFDLVKNGQPLPKNPTFEYPSLIGRLVDSTFANNTYPKGISTAMNLVNEPAYQEAVASSLRDKLIRLAAQ
jgi:hypothetical protein